MPQERPLFAAPSSRRLLPRAGRSRRDERLWRDAQPHLLRLARRAVADPDVEAVAAAGAQLALGLLEVDLVGVRELARDGHSLLARAAVGAWPAEHPRPATLDVSAVPLIALALASGHAIVSDDVLHDPRFPPPQHLLDLGIACAVTVPLAGPQGPVGAITVLSLTSRRFGRSTIDLLEAVGEILGAAFQRRRDEEELRGAEERYRTLVDQAPVCIQGIDRTARIDAINQAGLRMMNLSRDVAVGRSYLDLVAPGDRPRVAMLLSQALEGRPSEFDFDSAAGNRSFASSFIPVAGAEGEVLGLIGVTQDVTARRRAESVLRSSEERYRELFENASEAILTCDLEGWITSLNPAGEALAGYAPGDAVGRPVAEVVSEETFRRVSELAQAELERGRDGVTEPLVIRSRNGLETPVEASIRYVRKNGLPIGLQVIARDVSERLRLEAELRQAQKMEALGRLAGGIAHDFNNLVTAIAGYAQLALRAVPAGAGGLAGDLGAIVDAASHAASLTRQLLAFSRRQVVETQRFDAAALVAGMDEMLRRLVGPAVTVELHASAAPCSVDADPSQLEQIVLNLAVNARDAMPDGGTLRIECEHVERTGLEGPALRLRVSDTGIGMSDEVKARLFEPFFTTKAPGQGTGLGLATVYGIVDAYGGTISVESAAGAGTVFTVELPGGLPAEEAQASPDAALVPADGGETILLVEDEDALRTLAHRVLAHAGYTVLEASSGEEAVGICGTHDGPIDLVLTDVVMPGVNGIDVVARVGRLRPEVRRLIMSGRLDEAALGACLETGTELLEKPFLPEDLVRKVRDVLDAPAASPAALRAPSEAGTTLA